MSDTEYVEALGINKDLKKKLHTIILKFYKNEGRLLPWRETRDPYKILVSEIMLQQTQVPRVLPKYKEWLEKFPTTKSLKEAPQVEVIKAWSGLGYNNRALRLKEAARIVYEDHNDQFPHDPNDIEKLPGIGKYTARAIACFAKEQRVPVVDINIQRLFSRIFFIKEKADDLEPEKNIWPIAESLLPTKKYFEWNQALFDIASAYCQKEAKCMNCPLNTVCKSAFKVKKPVRNIKKKTPKTASAKGQQTLTGKKSTENKQEAKIAEKKIPRRIWRGKIVKALTAADEHNLTLAQIGKSIRSDYNHKQDKDWLLGIIKTLEKDKLIIVKGQRAYLA